ncbi:MAG TPA: hypothetical protein VG389_00320, partial [Myxococcota bacterium]|nr:hypothetical protein [Myxococcota bacterium]
AAQPEHVLNTKVAKAPDVSVLERAATMAVPATQATPIEPRALVNARWSRATVAVGETVELTATTDNLPDGTSATFTITRRDGDGRTGTQLLAIDTTTQADRVTVTWSPGDNDSGDGDPAEFEFTVTAAGLESRSGVLRVEQLAAHVIAEYFTDHDGRPWSEEEFVVLDDAGREVARGTTDEGGWLCLEMPGPGTYEIRMVDADGQYVHEDPYLQRMGQPLAIDPDDPTDHDYRRSQYKDPDDDWTPDEDDDEKELDAAPTDET